ncbi:MAG: quinone-dependent dihydroorotate dehydrogenase [Wenzhouxiangellaceae bacterium]|nr:quinone-dependent dihydroorotate dehydrogenase [Wenzhouxiangellaceae bacterium]
MYAWLRRGLFTLSPEAAHEVAMTSIKLGSQLNLPRLMAGRAPELETEVLGLAFPNPVGVAAGLDKNGDYIDALGQLGFGFIEVGTCTPEPQPGNPRPRMFRVPESEAIINRMGFNNKGVDYLVERLRQRRFKGPVGANIGKQKQTPVAQAIGDYRLCLEKVYPHCDYVAVNISSPNTENLRELQDTGYLRELASELVETRRSMAASHGLTRPIVIKIAPDWEPAALRASLETIADSGIDGLIATNTTVSREAIQGQPHEHEAGGLSGAPLKPPANAVLRVARETLGADFPIIGSGGIMSAEDAVEKMHAGADLVQLYTGFIYHGPALIKACVAAIENEFYQ